MILKKLVAGLIGILILAGAQTVGAQNVNQKKNSPRQVYGVAFYNLENLFDTINNNGKYDLEFSPQGKNKWDGYKYWSKIKNLYYAISQLKTKRTPEVPAINGVS